MNTRVIIKWQNNTHVFGQIYVFLKIVQDDLHLIFNEVLYKQKDRVAMSSPVGPTLSSAVLCFSTKLIAGKLCS